MDEPKQKTEESKVTIEDLAQEKQAEESAAEAVKGGVGMAFNPQAIGGGPLKEEIQGLVTK